MPGPYRPRAPGHMPPNYVFNGQAGVPGNPPRHRHPYPNSKYSSGSVDNTSKESMSAALQSSLGIPSGSSNPNPYPPRSSEHSYPNPNSQSSECEQIHRERHFHKNRNFENNAQVTPNERRQQSSNKYTPKNYYEQLALNMNGSHAQSDTEISNPRGQYPYVKPPRRYGYDDNPDDPESNRVLKQSAYEDNGESFALRSGRSPKTRVNSYAERTQTIHPTQQSHGNLIRPNNSIR